MVCVGASEGFNADLPRGAKHLSAMANADFAGDAERTARPPSPSGVAMAAMVSSKHKFPEWQMVNALQAY